MRKSSSFWWLGHVGRKDSLHCDPFVSATSLGVLAIMAVMMGCSLTAHAQFERRRAPRVPQPEFSIGFFGGLNTNIHTGDFNGVKSTYVCEKFFDGAGAGPNGGLEMQYNFDVHYATLLRLGYGSMYGRFLSARGQINLIDSSGVYEREHVWRPALTYGTAELLFNFTPISPRVQFMIGPTMAMNLGKSFTQEEHIITVSGKSYTFPNGTNTWIVDQGDMKSIRKIVLGAEIGVAIQFRISRTLLFTPTAYAHYFLQSPSQDLQWTILTFKLGASLRYVLSFDD